MNARRNRKSLVAVAALVAAAAATSANAELLQMDFTTVHTYPGPGGLYQTYIITGTFVWDSEVSSFDSDLDDIHYWEYISFDADVTFIDYGGFATEDTFHHGPTNGDSDNSIRTVYVPLSESSNMEFQLELWLPAMSFSGNFDITLGLVDAMSEASSPLPTTAGEYIATSGIDSDMQDYSGGPIQHASTNATVTPFEPPTPECIADINGDGALNFFDISAYLSLFTAGCP